MIRIVPLLVTISPASQLVRSGSNGVFTAATTGADPVGFQWQFNGIAITGATGPTLIVSNVNLANEGFYRVVSVNAYGSATSAPVRLEVAINPSVVIPPLSQNVVEDGQVTFSFQIAGNPPPFGFQLFRSSTLLTNYVTTDRTGFLSLANVSVADAGTYRIMVTNGANPSPGLALGPITLGVLADFDHDGLPDTWEIAHGFDTNNAADAGLDFDLDGSSNLQEYLAGTDPLMAASRLSLEAIRTTDSAIVLRFLAASNHTYSLQFRSPVDAHGWLGLSHFVAVPTNRWVLSTNQTTDASERYYRVTTPIAP